MNVCLSSYLMLMHDSIKCKNYYNYSDIQSWLSSNNPFIQQLISNVYRVNARLLVFVEIEA